MTKIFNIKSTLGVCSMVLLTSCAATRVNNTTLSEAALQQAEQDSLLYRNLFNQTQAAKDSAAVKDFNKIAASMKNLTQEKRKSLSKEILKNAQNNGITEEQTNIIKGVQYISNKESIKLKQKLADMFVYEKFFEKHGVQKKH